MASAEPFSECEPILDDRPIRQGDIFEWLAGSEEPWQLLGVVVTASCDIAQEKHRGILSYVPILPMTHYVGLFRFPGLLDRRARPLVDELTSTICAHQARNVPEFPEPLSKEAALEWARSRTSDEIAEDLRIADERARGELTSLLDDYRLVQKALRNEAFHEQLEALIRLRVRQGSAPEKAREQIWKDIESALETLPGDSFFIGGIGEQHMTGYIAYLRLVREIQHRHIAVKQSDLRGPSPAVARRIARLQSPYVYRLTQQLADVFASIGLPDEYDSNRRRLVESLASNAPRSL